MYNWRIMEQHATRKGFWLVFLAAVLWGTTGTAQALAPDGAQPAVVGTVRLVIGGLGLLGVAWARGHLWQHRKWARGAILAAAVSMAVYQLLFFAGVARTGVAVGTIVGIGSSPILAGVVGYLVRGERPGARWGLATILAVVGCGLLIGAGGRLVVDVGGILLALGAGLSYAIFTVASKHLLEENPPEVVMAVTFCIGALLLVPFVFLGDLSWLLQLRGTIVGLHLGLVTVVIAYSLFARGLRWVPVATAGTLTLGEPLTAGLLGLFLLGETLSLAAFAGIGLIFSGLVILFWDPAIIKQTDQPEPYRQRLE